MRTAQRRAKGKQSSLTRTAARITAQGGKASPGFPLAANPLCPGRRSPLLALV
ncbi:hypothetical protein HMPREF9436_01272 [Faecalibacterium cf. prausnitzii KLE1255]|uniref:Uncharacterized protein n=1 Tax=Faecalibacterium cf. prausnitzii KLE1255 TaxID=748224 RepID=E2ZHY2_9FIRM|nr:hypothetical protein HMPREF9436_01272 [Faecalibacterium cf. prausnitzii KLE1255]